MRLENQVCSFEQSKRLKELGVKNPSDNLIWFYCHDEGSGDKFPGLFKENIKGEFDFLLISSLPFEYDEDYFPDTSGNYPAFSVAELGLMLKYYVSYVFASMNDKEWAVINNFIREKTYHRTEAEARAHLLIFMIENGHLKVDDLNKILAS